MADTWLSQAERNSSLGHFFNSHSSLTMVFSYFSKNKSEEESRSTSRFMQKKRKKRCVRSLCCAPVFSAEQEQYNPRRGLQFHSSAHVSIINAKTSRNPYWSSQAYWCAAIVPPQWHRSHSIWSLFVTKTNDQITENPIKIDAKSNTCQFNSLKRSKITIKKLQDTELHTGQRGKLNMSAHLTWPRQETMFTLF